MRLFDMFPTIKRIRKPEFFLIPGNRLYGWELNKDLFFLILLRVAPQVDYYSSEIIWTNCNALPPRSGDMADLYAPEYDGMHCFNIASFTGDFKDFQWGLTPDMSDAEFREELIADLLSRNDTPKETRDRSISAVSYSLLSLSLDRLFTIYEAYAQEYFHKLSQSLGVEAEWDTVFTG